MESFSELCSSCLAPVFLITRACSSSKCQIELSAIGMKTSHKSSMVVLCDKWHPHLTSPASWASSPVISFTSSQCFQRSSCSSGLRMSYLASLWIRHGVRSSGRPCSPSWCFYLCLFLDLSTLSGSRPYSVCFAQSISPSPSFSYSIAIRIWSRTLARILKMLNYSP